MTWYPAPASLSHVTGTFILPPSYSSHLRVYVHTVQVRVSVGVEARGQHRVSSLVIVLHLIL